MRKKIFAEAAREHMIAGDILKTDWIGNIPKADATIVIAEGLAFLRAMLRDRQL